MIFKNIPNEFSSRFEVVSCFCELSGKILLLLRSPHKPEGNKWGVPAGKVDSGEAIEEAMIRELKEEISLNSKIEELIYLDKVYIRDIEFDYVYYMYKLLLSGPIEVKLNIQEHQEFLWVSPEEALKMDLMRDEDECIEMFY